MNNPNKQNQHPSDDALDTLLRVECHWEAPSELTNRLLALVPGAPVLPVATATPAVVARPWPRPWYSQAVLLLTALAVGLSLAVAWQFYAALGTQLGLEGYWAQLQAAPATGVDQLVTTVPASRYVVAVLSGISKQLHWLLLAAVLWLALDGWTPRFSLRRQQTT